LKELEKVTGSTVMSMSSVAREGVTEVLRSLRARIDDDRVRQRPAAEAEPWRP